MDRRDRSHDPDLGPSQRRELRDLPEPAHRKLEDAELGIGLEPAERQRNADLVVVAALGRDRAPLGSADCREQILRGRLADRARDRDNARLRAGAHSLAERSERLERGVRNKSRGGSARDCMLTEVRTRPDGDEQVALLDRA